MLADATTNAINHDASAATIKSELDAIITDADVTGKLYNLIY